MIYPSIVNAAKNTAHAPNRSDFFPLYRAIVKSAKNTKIILGARYARYHTAFPYTIAATVNTVFTRIHK